jgi:hypothetical protein
MKRAHRRRAAGWLALATLCSGTLAGQTCEIRTRDALVNGTKTFVSGVLLDPTNFTDFFYQDTTTTDAQE